MREHKNDLIVKYFIKINSPCITQGLTVLFMSTSAATIDDNNTKGRKEWDYILWCHVAASRMVVAIFLDRLLCIGVMASCPFNPKYYRTFPVPLSNLAIVFGYDYYYYYYGLV